MAGSRRDFSKFGIEFDDDYDYSQHLRSLGDRTISLNDYVQSCTDLHTDDDVEDVLKLLESTTDVQDDLEDDFVVQAGMLDIHHHEAETCSHDDRMHPFSSLDGQFENLVSEFSRDMAMPNLEDTDSDSNGFANIGFHSNNKSIEYHETGSLRNEFSITDMILKKNGDPNLDVKAEELALTQEDKNATLNLMLDSGSESDDSESNSNDYNQWDMLKPQEIFKYTVESAYTVSSCRSGPRVLDRMLEKNGQKNVCTTATTATGSKRIRAISEENIVSDSSTKLVSSYRPQDETADQKRDRKKQLKEAKKERKMEKKYNVSQFKRQKILLHQAI